MAPCARRDSWQDAARPQRPYWPRLQAGREDHRTDGHTTRWTLPRQVSRRSRLYVMRRRIVGQNEWRRSEAVVGNSASPVRCTKMGGCGPWLGSGWAQHEPKPWQRAEGMPVTASKVARGAERDKKVAVAKIESKRRPGIRMGEYARYRRGITGKSARGGRHVGFDFCCVTTSSILLHCLISPFSVYRQVPGSVMHTA